MAVEKILTHVTDLVLYIFNHIFKGQYILFKNNMTEMKYSDNVENKKEWILFI